MKASEYQENAEEFMLYVISCGKQDSIEELNRQCSSRIYKSLRLVKSARTQLEKCIGRKYGIRKRTITYSKWNEVND